MCFACSPKTGFDAFFEKEVPAASEALDLPKWLPMIAIPKSAKEDVKRLSKGMKKVKLLRYDKEQSRSKKRFMSFAAAEGLEEYLNYKDVGTKLEILSKEDQDVFKEIIFSIETEEEYVIFGLTGKMKKRDFQNAISEINERRNEKG